MSMIISGQVIKGKNRGQKLGFPTVNIRLQPEFDEGIYISEVKVDKVWYPALTFIGVASTFKETAFQAESYLLNYKRNLYGKKISIRLIKKMRDNIDFKSEQELIKQMEKDKKEAEEYFNV